MCAIPPRSARRALNLAIDRLNQIVADTSRGKTDRNVAAAERAEFAEMRDRLPAD